jgi:positive regulator of sigma E activity
MSSFILYVVGLIVLLGGLIYAAHLAGLPQAWTIVGALVVLGFGVMVAVAKTRTKDISTE